MNSFNIGDVVKLKSGGPDMSILSTPKGTYPYYTC